VKRRTELIRRFLKWVREELVKVRNAKPEQQKDVRPSLRLVW